MLQCNWFIFVQRNDVFVSIRDLKKLFKNLTPNDGWMDGLIDRLSFSQSLSLFSFHSCLN